MNKILLITAFPPSELAAAEKNTKIMLSDLGKHYEVDLVYFKDADVSEYVPDSESVHIAKMVPNSMKYRLMNILTCPFLHPIFTVRFNWNLRRHLQKLIDKNDYKAIIFDHSQTMMYARMLKYNGPKLLLCHDVEAQRFERKSNKLMAWLCRKSEKYILSTSNAVVFSVSKKDVDLIQVYYHIPASVFLLYLDDRIINNTPKQLNDNYILFGNWVRPDNNEGALWLLNSMDEYLQNPIKVDIIGKGFPADKLKDNYKNLSINVIGFVDNPYQMIAESRAMLCPLLTGAGIKVKVIESLASGTPVLGTDIAFEGFDEKFSKFMIRCKTPKDFVDNMNKVNFDINERMTFKDMYIKDYNSDSIPEWLNRNLLLQ